jgi:hypothetical protein
MEVQFSPFKFRFTIYFGSPYLLLLGGRQQEALAVLGGVTSFTVAGRYFAQPELNNQYYKGSRDSNE